jgi:hypothetical protein
LFPCWRDRVANTGIGFKPESCLTTWEMRVVYSHSCYSVLF